MGDRSTNRPARRHIRWHLGLTAMAILAVFGSRAPVMATVASQASTSRESREEAVRAIPFDQLTEETQQKLSSVTSTASMYRRMPVKVIDCNPDLYVFLVRYPEVVVNIWDLMGITQVSAKRTGDFTLSTSDGGGTKSDIELVYGTRDKHVFYATAVYDGPLTARPVQARCVLLLQTGYLTNPQGRTFIASQLDVFVKFDHLGVDLAARTLHPWLGRTADYNFTESIGFLQQISQATETNVFGVRRLAARLTDIDAEVRQYFVALAVRASEQMAARVQAAPPPPDRPTGTPQEFPTDVADRPLTESR